MLAPEQVTVMMRLQQLGWGTKRIARELGCDRKTSEAVSAAGCLADVSAAAAVTSIGWT